MSPGRPGASVHGDVQGYEAREGAGPTSSSSTPSPLAQ